MKVCFFMLGAVFGLEMTRPLSADEVNKCTDLNCLSDIVQDGECRGIADRVTVHCPMVHLMGWGSFKRPSTVKLLRVYSEYSIQYPFAPFTLTLTRITRIQSGNPSALSWDRLLSKKYRPLSD